MNSIVIIGVYFGKFPQYMKLWEKSCENNKNIDFIVFTDQERKTETKNLQYIKMTLSELSNLASEKLQMNIKITKPYKCCDFKPVYGIIFEDYIKEYDFWGHCDFDMIFGDIRKLITDEILKKYDKILPLGHLSLYRNTFENNQRYKDKGSKVGSYKEVFSSNKSFAFDEMGGICSIYKQNDYPFYDARIFADISMIYKRFRLALKDKNYKNQVFYWEKGKIFRTYEKDKKIQKEEFVYIHFKKRKNMNINFESYKKIDSFFITNNGFYEKRIDIPTIEDINKYNRYNGIIYEKTELLFFKIKEVLKKIKNKLNN